MAESSVKKVTKKERFAEVRDIVEKSGADNTAEILAFIDHEVELLNKKSSSGKTTKTQALNAELAEIVLTALAGSAEPMTVGEVMAAVEPQFAEKGDDVVASNQRVTSLLTKLLNDGKVVRTVEKKKAHFSVA
jgi:hypothetical protein